jgi:hypothetical protein
MVDRFEGHRRGRRGTIRVIAHPPTESRLHPLRVGRLTASRVSAMLAKTKIGPSAQRADLLWELVCERLTGESAERDFPPTRAMQRGIDSECLARADYEAETGNLVTTSIGFMERQDCLAGASPDGVVIDSEMDGVTEDTERETNGG